MAVVHKLLTKDLENLTGLCVVCGLVSLYARQDRGKTQYRCSGGADASRKGKHGLTRVEARAMKDGAVCGLCGHDDNLVVDHDHITGKIREVLCAYCNSGLGFFRDNPELLIAAARYVEKHRERESE